MAIICNCIDAHLCHPIISIAAHAISCECHDCEMDKFINHNSFTTSCECRHCEIDNIHDSCSASDRCINCQDCESAIDDGTERCEGAHIENEL
jgi:hypothetical protein